MLRIFPLFKVRYILAKLQNSQFYKKKSILLFLLPPHLFITQSMSTSVFQCMFIMPSPVSLELLVCVSLSKDPKTLK
jgi:hypothetical protein